MAVKFFGQFLVEKGVVSRNDLLQAIELQERKNLKLGEIALELGYVGRADIDRAHHAQLSRDMKLGDLLVEMGCLTLPQLNEVVTRQKNNHLYIGEALVAVNAITADQLREQLEVFRLDQAPYATDRIELPAGIPDSAIWEMTADLTCKMIRRMLDLPFRAEACRTATSLGNNFMMAAIDMSGDVEARYLLSVSEEVQKAIARAVLREESVDNEPVEVLEDAVMEFVNVVCGNVASKASQMGTIIDINPPVTVHPPATGLTVPDGRTGLCLPIHLVEGERMELALFIRN